MNGFDLQPHLADAVVALRPLTPGDWSALSGVAADPLIWASHPAHDRWREPVFRRFFDDALASGGALVAVSPGGSVIGSSRYDDAHAGPGEIEIGWTFLARETWGGMVNAAIKRLMIGHALRWYDRVVFRIGEHNHRSRRAIAKIGGELTDRIQTSEIAGTQVRHVVYAIDRARFAAGPLGVPAKLPCEGGKA